MLTKWYISKSCSSLNFQSCLHIRCSFYISSVGPEQRLQNLKEQNQTGAVSLWTCPWAWKIHAIFHEGERHVKRCLKEYTVWVHSISWPCATGFPDAGQGDWHWKPGQPAEEQEHTKWGAGCFQKGLRWGFPPSSKLDAAHSRPVWALNATWSVIHWVPLTSSLHKCTDSLRRTRLILLVLLLVGLYGLSKTPFISGKGSFSSLKHLWLHTSMILMLYIVAMMELHHPAWFLPVFCPKKQTEALRTCLTFY